MDEVFNKNKQLLYPIRSFVCRYRKLTKGQTFAIQNYWNEIGIEFKMELLNFLDIFDHPAPLIIEIGFGMCHSLVTMAKNNPDHNFLGIEVYKPGIASCVAAAKKMDIKNLRVIGHDAVKVLEHMIPNNTISIVQLFFPDPWHKSRHNKRRLVQIPFAKLVIHKLIKGGIFHIATDSKSYAEHIIKVIKSIDRYTNRSANEDFVQLFKRSLLTKFEERSQKLGNNVWELIFEKY